MAFDKEFDVNTPASGENPKRGAKYQVRLTVFAGRLPEFDISGSIERVKDKAGEKGINEF